jgi:hypothetical protein
MSVIDGMAEWSLNLYDLDQRGYKVVRPYSYKAHQKEQDDLIEPDTPLTPVKHFDTVYQGYRRLIGMSDKHKSPNPPSRKVGKRRKLCICSDTHGDPYQKGVAGICAEKPDLILIVGDIYDCLAVSRFEKPNYIPLEIESANVRAMLEEFAAVAPVKLCKGNHDNRVLRMFLQRMDPQVIASMRALGMINADILAITSLGLPNVEVCNNLYGFHTVGGDVMPEAMKDGWMIFAGDACFMHAEKARKGELTTVRAIATEWYFQWRKILGLPDVRVLAQAHVHSAGIGYANGGHLIMLELGCMTNPQVLQYQMDGNMGYRPPTIGYMVIEQNQKDGKWITDPASIRFIPC